MSQAHSTPMNRTMSRIIGADPNFSVPSPIREEDEEMEGEKRDGRRINRSILDDLSATMREENERKREGGEMMEDHHVSQFSFSVDLTKYVSVVPYNDRSSPSTRTRR